MARRGREPAALDDAAAKAAIMKILRHSLKCVDSLCSECARWRDVLDGGTPALLLAGKETADSAGREDAVHAAAVEVIEALSTARSDPSVAMRRSWVEDRLQNLARVIGEVLPAPRGSSPR